MSSCLEYAVCIRKVEPKYLSLISICFASINSLAVSTSPRVIAFNSAPCESAGTIQVINGTANDANGDSRKVRFYYTVSGEEKAYPKMMLGISLFSYGHWL